MNAPRRTVATIIGWVSDGRPGKTASIWIVSVIFTVALLAFSVVFTLPPADFLPFWSAGRVLLQGGDVYDAAVLAPFQSPHWTTGYVLPFWNPPWFASLVVPLGVLPYEAARVVWVALGCSAMAFALLALSWRRGRSPSAAFALAAWACVPFALMAFRGQSSFLVVAGVAAGLYWWETRPVAAGFALFFCAMKPHLAAGLIPLLGVRVFAERRYGVLTGLGIAAALLALPAWALRPAVFSEWLMAMRAPGLWDFQTPSLCWWLSARFGWPPGLVRWPLFGLAAWVGAWAAFRSLRGAGADAGAWAGLALSASLVGAPYFWSHDMVVLVPAMALAGFTGGRRLWLPCTLFFGMWAVRLATIDETWFAWAPPLVVLSVAWDLVGRGRRPGPENG